MKGTRTLKQNNSLHLYCTMLGHALNEASVTLHDVCGEIDIPWTTQNVRAFIWETVRRAGNLSTLGTYAAIHEHLADNHRIYIAWPGKVTKYLEILAYELNERGIELRREIVNDTFRGPWSMSKVKELLWRTHQRAIYLKESTTELDTVDPSLIYESINRFTSGSFGVSVEWPAERPGQKRP